jgi:tetratricopeptide (TPR) repeat protein
MFEIFKYIKFIDIYWDKKKHTFVKRIFSKKDKKYIEFTPDKIIFIDNQSALYYFISEMYYKKENKTFLKYLLKSLEIDPLNKGALLLKTQYFIKNKNYEEAEKILLKLKRNTNDSIVDESYLYSWGEVYLNNKKYNKAKEYFQRALELNPSNQKLVLKLGLCYDKLNLLNKAKKLYVDSLDKIKSEKIKKKIYKMDAEDGKRN